MSNYDELFGIDMTRDANLPVPEPVKKQVTTERRLKGKTAVPLNEAQLNSQMPDFIPHVNNPEHYTQRDNIVITDTDYSVEKEV